MAEAEGHDTKQAGEHGKAGEAHAGSGGEREGGKALLHVRMPVASLQHTPVRCVALHPRQPLLAIGFDTGVIHVWNVVTHQMMVALRSPGSIAAPVSGLAFSPDGSLLASACDSHEEHSGGTGAGQHALRTDGLVWLAPGASANQMLVPDRICLWNANDNFRYLKDNVNVKSAAKLLLKRKHEDGVRRAGKLQPWIDSDLDRIKLIDKGIAEDRKTGVRALVFVPAFQNRQALLASASANNWIRLWDFERDIVWYCSNPWRSASVNEVNLYKVDAKSPEPWHLSRESREEVGPITELTVSADGLLIAARTVAGRCAVWLVPPGSRLRADGRGARLYLHPDAMDRILREKVERENFAELLERRRRDELVSDKEEAAWKARIAAAQGEAAAQLALLERRRQKAGNKQRSTALVVSEESGDGESKQSDAGALVTSVAVKNDDSSPAVAMMSPDDMRLVNNTEYIRHAAVQSDNRGPSVTVWLHVCLQHNEPHTRDSWPCWDGSEARPSNTKEGQKTPEVQVQPTVKTIREAASAAMNGNSQGFSFAKLFTYEPLRLRQDTKQQKNRFKPFHLVRLKPVADRPVVDRKTKKEKSFFDDSEAGKVLHEPMCKTHEDDEELCFVNSHHDPTAHFPACENGAFYRLVFDGGEEDASEGREGVVRRLYRESPPLRTMHFVPTQPRLTASSRNYRLVVGARFALGLVTIDVPHECLDGKTERERKEDAKKYANLVPKGLPQPKRFDVREELELPNKWREFEQRECLPKGESLVDVGSGGHAMYMALAHHIFGNSALYGLVRGCVADVLGNDNLLEFFIRQKIKMFLDKHVDLKDPNNKPKYPKISRLKLGILNYDQKGQYGTWHEYVNAVRTSRTPGSTIEAAVAAIIFGVDIHITLLDSGKRIDLTSLGSRKLFVSQLRVVEDGKVAMKPSRVPLPPLKVVKSANYYRIVVMDQTAEERSELLGLSGGAYDQKVNERAEQRYWGVVSGWKETAFRTEEDDPRPWTWPVWRRVEVETGYTRDEIKALYAVRHHHAAHTEEDLLKYLYVRLPDLVHIDEEKREGRELSHDERFNLAHKQRLTLYSNAGAAGKSLLGAHEKMIMETRAALAKQLKEKEESQANLSDITELLRRLDREKRRLRRLQGKPSRRASAMIRNDDDDEDDGEVDPATGERKRKRKPKYYEPDSDDDLEDLKQTLRKRKAERAQRRKEEKARAEKLAKAGVLPKDVEQLLKDSSSEEELSTSSSSSSTDVSDDDDVSYSDESNSEDEEEREANRIKEEQEKLRKAYDERQKKIREAQEKLKAEKEKESSQAAGAGAGAGAAGAADAKYGGGGGHRRRGSGNWGGGYGYTASADDELYHVSDASVDDNKQYLMLANALSLAPVASVTSGQSQMLAGINVGGQKPFRATNIARGAKWVVWMKYERFAVDHVQCSEYGPFFATAEASHFAMANLVDFRPMRASALLPAVTTAVEVTVAGPTVQQILKRPEFAWACALRVALTPNALPASNTPLLPAHVCLEENAYYELVPWPQRYDPTAVAHGGASDVTSGAASVSSRELQHRAAYRLNIWSIAHRSFSPFVVGTHYKPIKFVLFPSQELRKVMLKMGFLKREESFVFAVSSGKGVPDAATGHVSIFHSFRWFNNKDSAADIPAPPPLPPGSKADFDWKHAHTTQSLAVEPTVTLAAAAAAMASAGAGALRGYGGGSGGMSGASIHAMRALPRAPPLAIEGTPEARPPKPDRLAEAVAAARAVAGKDPESPSNGVTGSGSASAPAFGGALNGAHAGAPRTLPSTMPPAALPPAIALAPVPRDPTMQPDRGVQRSDGQIAPPMPLPPSNLQTFTNVVNSAEEAKGRSANAWCWWPF